MLPLLILMCACFVDVSLGNGRLVDPPMRSYMWRVGFNTPKNYNDHTLTCGGFERQHDDVNLGRCGVCGDPWDGERQNEAGGKYAKGVITREYTAGNDVTMTIEMLAPRGGYFEVRLCPVSNPSVAVTQECLDQHPLEIINGQGTRYDVDGELMEHHGIYDLTVRLPADVTCDQCVVQWKYHAGNEWGYNPDGRMCRGCGPQFEQYNCADVRINQGSGNAAIRPNPSQNTADQVQNEVEPTTQRSTITTPKVFTFERDSIKKSDSNSPSFPLERDSGISSDTGSNPGTDSDFSVIRDSVDSSTNDGPTTPSKTFEIQRDSIFIPSSKTTGNAANANSGSNDQETDKNPFDIMRDTVGDSGAASTNIDGSVNPSPTPYGGPSMQEPNSPEVVFSDLPTLNIDNSNSGLDPFLDLIPSDPTESSSDNLPSPTPYVPVPADDFLSPPREVTPSVPKSQTSDKEATTVRPSVIVRDTVFDNVNDNSIDVASPGDQLPEKVFIPDPVFDNLPGSPNHDTSNNLGNQGQSNVPAVATPTPTYAPLDPITTDDNVARASIGDDPAKTSESASLSSKKASIGSSKSSSKASTGKMKKVHIKANGGWGQQNAWATYMNQLYQQRMAAYLATQVWGNRGQWGTGTTWGAGNGVWGAGNGAWGATSWPTSAWGTGTTWGGNWGNNWNQNSWGNTNSQSNTWGNSNSNSWGNNGNSWNSQTGNSWGNSQSSLATHLPTCGSNQRLVCQGLGNFVNDAQTKQYCNQNCPTGGRCPQNICSCSCAYRQSFDCRYKTNGIALPSNHQWCNTQCNSGACPVRYCECSTVTNW